MGHIWAKKSDLGHFSLQCELSPRVSKQHSSGILKKSVILNRLSE